MVRVTLKSNYKNLNLINTLPDFFDAKPIILRENPR
jgi:hypothetical protein